MSPLDAHAQAALDALPGDAAIAILDPLGECLALARRGDAWASASAAARHATLPPLARPRVAADVMWIRDLLAHLAPQLGGAAPVRALRTATLELVVSDALEELWLVAAVRAAGASAGSPVGARGRLERALGGLAHALVAAGLAERR